MKEILNRLNMPPENEIPDARMVAENEIKRWSIPETKIAIELVEKGPQGAYRFFESGDPLTGRPQR